MKNKTKIYMEQQPEVKAGVSKAIKAPEPIVQSSHRHEHWFVQVVSGYTLALAMVSSLALFYTMLTTVVLT